MYFDNIYFGEVNCFSQVDLPTKNKSMLNLGNNLSGIKVVKSLAPMVGKPNDDVLPNIHYSMHKNEHILEVYQIRKFLKQVNLRLIFMRSWHTDLVKT